MELVPVAAGVGGGAVASVGAVRPHELVALYLATLRTDSGRRAMESALTALARAAATLSAHESVRRRDRAFIALLVGCGLPREECLTVETPDSDALPGHMVVHGKGGRERDVFLPGWAARELEGWIRHRGRFHGPLLAPITRHGRVRVGAQWSTAAASRRFCELAAAAGVECTPHDTRRTWITAELARGTDVVLVARAVGHQSPSTTAGYDRRGLVALEELAGHQPALEGFAT